MNLCTLLLCGAFLLGTQDADQADQAGEDALDAGLDAAVGLINAGDWDAARQQILSLVDTHGESDYVLLHAHRILDGLKQCAFWSETEVPPVEELMAGEIQSYDPRTGKIKVRYRRDEEAYERWKKERDPDDKTPEYLRELISLLGLTSAVGSGDFTYWNGVPMHPIYFAGPYTVEVTGRMPSEDDKIAALFATPEVVISCGEEGTYRIRFGYPLHGGVGWYTTPSLVHFRAGKATRLDEDKETPLKHGRSYSVKVNVSSKSITASANGKAVVKCKKQGDSYGQFGFRGCPDVDELVISGQANTAWVEGLRDTWIQQGLDAFDEEHDPLKELPESLAKRIGEEAEPKELLEEFPGGFHPKHPVHVTALEKLAKTGELRGMLGYVESLKDESATSGFKKYLSTQFLWRLGRLTESLATCEAVCMEYPDYAPAAISKAHLLASLTREDEAFGVLETFIAAHPAEASPRVAYTGLLMSRGRFDEARAAMREAFDAGVPAAELSSAAFMLTRAEDGPDWSEPYEYTSRHYVVRSDMNQKICIETTKTLEAALAMYRRLFGQPDADDAEQDRYAVYLFSGKAGYHAYTRDLLGSSATGTAGLYSPILKQLIIWNLPDKDQLTRTIRHEGFHQYLDRLIDVDPPTWFNEGTAEYVETAELVRGRMTPGVPVLANVNTLSDKDAKWLDLEDLLSALPSGFYGNAGQSYAESWALVHYLLEGGGREERTIYQDYLQALLDGGDSAKAFEKAFAGQSMQSLLRAVKAHVRELDQDA